MGKFKKFLLESRWLNLEPLTSKLENEYTDDNISVHFTDFHENFLISNKSPTHHDPVGVYAFPRKYVMDLDNQDTQSFFDKKYIYILKPSSDANILDLSKITDESAIELLEKMGIEEDVYEVATHGNGISPGHKFWGALELARHRLMISKLEDRPHSSNSKHKFNFIWNSFFDKTGYNVLYDPGESIIHSNEPSQYVFLEKGAFKILDIIRNKSTEWGGTINFIKKMFDIEKFFKQNDYNYVAQTKSGNRLIIGPNSIELEGTDYFVYIESLHPHVLNHNPSLKKEFLKFVSLANGPKLAVDTIDDLSKKAIKKYILDFCNTFGFSPKRRIKKVNPRIHGNGYVFRKSVKSRSSKDPITLSLYFDMGFDGQATVYKAFLYKNDNNEKYTGFEISVTPDTYYSHTSEAPEKVMEEVFGKFLNSLPLDSSVYSRDEKEIAKEVKSAIRYFRRNVFKL